MSTLNIHDKCASQPEYTADQIRTYIINLFKFDRHMGLDEKTYWSAFVYTHKDLLIDFDEFYEEECHLSLANWAYQLKDLIRDDQLVDDKVYHLLYNIILIFEIIPITVDDLFDLKIFDKLNKIRQIMRSQVFNLLEQKVFAELDRLITYWTQFCTDNSVLLKKRQRTEGEEENSSHDEEKERKWKKARVEDNEDSENENEHENEELDTNSETDTESQTEQPKKRGILKYRNIKTKTNKKLSVKWNEENLNKTALYDKTHAPINSIILPESDVEEPTIEDI